MKREDRYTVLKHTDESAALNQIERANLYDLCDKVRIYREQAGKAPLRCAVVESDWPEYEPTWAAIGARVHGKLTNEQKLRAALVRLIGSDDREELLKMRAFVEVYVPGEDKAMALAGIDALLETQP